MLKWLVKHKMHKKFEEIFSGVEFKAQPLIIERQALDYLSPEIRNVLLEESEKAKGEEVVIGG